MKLRKKICQGMAAKRIWWQVRDFGLLVGDAHQVELLGVLSLFLSLNIITINLIKVSWKFLDCVIL